MQRVNLYQDELKKTRILLPAHQLLVIAVLAVMGMAVLSFWVRSLPEEPRAEADALQADVDKLEQEVKALQDKVAKMAPNEALIRQVEALRNRLRNTGLLRKAVIPPPTMSRFSSYLEGLGRQIQEGIWLSEIRIGDQGRSFLIRGGTFDPAMVPEFIQALEAEPVYNGLSFDNLTMFKVDDEHSYLNFSIATHCLPDEECK